MPDEDVLNMEILPDEMLEKVMCYCSAAAVLSMSLLNRRFQCIAQSEIVWTRAFQRDFSSRPANPVLIADFNELQRIGLNSLQLPFNLNTALPNHTETKLLDPNIATATDSRCSIPSRTSKYDYVGGFNSQQSSVGVSEPSQTNSWQVAYRIR